MPRTHLAVTPLERTSDRRSRIRRPVLARQTAARCLFVMVMVVVVVVVFFFRALQETARPPARFVLHRLLATQSR